MNTAPTFTLGDGKVVTDFGLGIETAYSIAIQSDGKIVVAGVGGSGDFALARYNPDGSLDSGFGGDGRLITPIGTGNDVGYSLAIQADGKILVTGSSQNGANLDFALVRYNPDGSLDTTFDGDGKLTTPIGPSDDTGTSIAIQADGKILVVGSRIDGSNDFALARYNTNGSLDTTFDSDGKRTTDFGLGNDYGRGVAIQPDGRILVVGISSNGSNDDFALARYNIDGTLDASFSGDGKVTTAFAAGGDVGESVAVQADGKILVAGASWSGGTDSRPDFALARYNPDGSLDTSFNFGGKLTTDFGFTFDRGYSVLIQSDGKILVAGESSGKFALARYNVNGSLDTTFDADGKLTTDIAGECHAYSAALQSDGKILLAGENILGFAVARYNADGSLDATFDSSKADTLDGAPVFTGDSGAVVLDSSVKVNDADLVATGNYAGAAVTLVRHGGPSPDDVFYSSGNLGTLAHGGDLDLSGVTIGTVTSNSAGVLSLAFNSNASQNRVDEALSSIAYANIGNGPHELVQIDWTFGDGNTGTQGSGGALAATGSTLVSVDHNHAPTLSHPIANGTAIAASPFSFVVPENTFSDADAGDTLSYTATLSNATALPDWLLFDGTSHSFSGLPPGSAAGGLYIRVTATDSSNASVSDVFLLTTAVLTTGTMGNDTISGTLNPDVIYGLDGNDRLTGSEGNDTLEGGAGDDILIGEAAATDRTLSGWGGVIILIGSDTHVDVLNGGDGNDVLDDWIGANTMIGGAGDDTYVGSFVELIELANGGNDTILSYGTLSLPDNVENVTLLGSYYATVTGNELDNFLTGNSGRNILDGGAGNDTLLGGNDNDHLTGGAGVDDLQGGEGDDMFFLASVSEFAVGEVIDGGGGFNELRYTGDADATLVLTANASGIGTIRIVDTGGDWAGTARINVDATAALGNYGYLDIVGNAGDNILIGNAQANSLYGGYGNDTLVGSEGDDGMNGNDGSDVFLIASGADHGPNERIDGDGGVGTPNGNVNEIRFTSTTPGDTLILSSHISNIAKVAISSAAGDLTGTIDLNLNASALSLGICLVGNAGANRISGTAGADIVSGDIGNDTLVGGLGNDALNGGLGLDTANFSGARAGYTLTRNGASYVVTDTNPENGHDGTDTLVGVERIQFSDVEVGVASEPGMRIGHVEFPANWLAYYTVGDFNSDGKTDIWWKTQAGATGVWTISNGNTWDPTAMHSPFTDWTTVDNNGDGKADLAFEHTAAGGAIQWDNAEQTISAGSIGVDHGWAMF